MLVVWRKRKTVNIKAKKISCSGGGEESRWLLSSDCQDKAVFRMRLFYFLPQLFFLPSSLVLLGFQCSSLCLSACLPVFLSVCLPVCSVFLPLRMSVCLSCLFVLLQSGIIISKVLLNPSSAQQHRCLLHGNPLGY